MIATDKGDRIYTGRVITSGGLAPWSPFGHIRVRTRVNFSQPFCTIEYFKKIDMLPKINIRPNSSIRNSLKK